MIKEFLLNIKSSEFKKIKKDLDEYCMLLYKLDFCNIEKEYKKLTQSLESIKNFTIKENNETFANSTFVVKLYISLIYEYSKFLQEIKKDNCLGRSGTVIEKNNLPTDEKGIFEKSGEKENE